MRRTLVGLLLVLTVFLTIYPFRLEQLSGVRVSAVLEPQEGLRLPIVMYHQVLKSRASKYTVSPEQLEADFIAIKKAGFEPVFMSEVIDWVEGHGELPAKPVIITFDDGHYNNLYYGLPLARKHNVKFMISPITGYSKFSTESGDHSNPNYSYLTWSQIKEAVDSGLVEIGNHTHKMHSFKPRFGIMSMKGEAADAYTAALKGDIGHAQELIEQSGVKRPSTFVYPFGKYSQTSRELLLEMGFKAFLTCNEWVSRIEQGKPETLYTLGRFNRDGGMSTEGLIKKIGS